MGHTLPILFIVGVLDLRNLTSYCKYLRISACTAHRSQQTKVLSEFKYKGIYCKYLRIFVCTAHVSRQRKVIRELKLKTMFCKSLLKYLL